MCRCGMGRSPLYGSDDGGGAAVMVWTTIQIQAIDGDSHAIVDYSIRYGCGFLKKRENKREGTDSK